MKLKEILKNIIKEISSEEQAVKNAEIAALKAKQRALASKLSAVQSGKEEVMEVDIDEMANVAIKYQIAPDVDISQFPGKKGRILSALKDVEEPVSKIELVDKMGLTRQQQINTEFMELVAQGAIVPSSEQSAPRFFKAKPEPKVPTGDEEDDDNEPEISPEEEDTGIVSRDLTDDEIDASFAKAKAAGDEEPELGKVDKYQSSMSSAKSKAVDFFLDDSNDRLLKKLISAFGTTKLKIREEKEPSDVGSGDFTSAEKKRKEQAQSSIDILISQMAEKIKSEEDSETRQEILNILAKKLESVGYNMLYKKIAREVGVSANVATPQNDKEKDKEVVAALDDLEDDNEEEDNIDEGQMLREMLQRRAKIIK